MEFDLKNVKDFDPNTVYLKDGKYLDGYKGGILNFSEGLPHGILDKRYTGVGATTVEIRSPRKSIIVFPFRKLAIEKFEKYVKTYPVYYVGTDDNNKSKSINDIKNFILKNEDKNIKFFVVADSIDKVVQGIEKSGQNPYKEYFMVLDEVEILQMQSGFRDKLPLCFDYFEKFDEKCFVSATLLDFSDDDLKKLPRYKVEKYEFSEEEGQIEYKEDLNLKIYNSNLPHLAVARDLTKFYKDNSQSKYKFFIGLNSKEAISQFIIEFEKENKVAKISVIISDTGKQGILTKYHGEIVDGKLPSNITLSTCIAWSGIDINEPYFAVAISLNTKLHHHFSFENLIQFFGRCRLKSNSQLIRTFVLGQEYLNKKETIIPIAKRILDLDSLIDYIENNVSFKRDKESILKDLSESENALIYRSIDGNPKSNWLINDLDKYKNRIIEDYLDGQKGLIERLKVRYNIISKNTEDYSFLEEVIQSTKEKETMNLEAFLDNLKNKKISNQLLVNVIKSPGIPSKRVAAYWYLFGEIILQDSTEGLQLAKYYSGFDNKVINKFVLPVTKIVLDSIYLYHFEISTWEHLINNLGLVCNGKSRNCKEFLKVFKQDKFESYFDSIFKQGTSSTNINYFMKHVLGLTPTGKAKGGQTFLIEKEKKYIPSIFKKIPLLREGINKISKKKSDNDILNFNNINPHTLLNVKFKIY